MEDIQIKSYCQLFPGQVRLNGKVYIESVQKPCEMQAFLTDLYNRLGIDYRKFFKMDVLSKQGFLAAELLMNGFEREQPKEDTAIILFNRTGSLNADEAYQLTIPADGDYFPSPAVFVYTLPNIVTGEIAIRNRIHGETVFYVLPQPQGQPMEAIIRETMLSAGMKYALAGWLEAESGSFMMLCEAGGNDGLMALNAGNIEKMIN
ncbi:MAG: hypothetical protein LBN71_02510 [Tannerella sp.]|jgi:hypothetical protein|nr:hypothetical protein [Tannerella sp.]